MSEVPAWPQGTSHFLTLTYNDDNLPPRVAGADRHTLNPKHLELFWKRVRRRSKQSIRYFAAGEYGDSTRRPHYHAIVFNLRLDDLCPMQGQHHERKLDVLRPHGAGGLSRSPFLESLWAEGRSKKPRGVVAVGSVTFESASYVARYVMKKALGLAKPAHETFQAEFCRMSLKPAIGDFGFERFYSDYYPSNTFTRSDGHVSAPPKRWLNLIKERDPLFASELVQQKVALRRPLSPEQLKSKELNLRARARLSQGDL